MGQMDPASKIFDHMYLGTEWNASNLEELEANKYIRIFFLLIRVLFLYSCICIYELYYIMLYMYFIFTLLLHLHLHLYIYVIKIYTMIYLMNILLDTHFYQYRTPNFQPIFFRCYYVLNVTKEISNFYPDKIKYHNVRYVATC